MTGVQEIWHESGSRLFCRALLWSAGWWCPRARRPPRNPCSFSVRLVWESSNLWSCSRESIIPNSPVPQQYPCMQIESIICTSNITCNFDMYSTSQLAVHSNLHEKHRGWGDVIMNSRLLRNLSSLVRDKRLTRQYSYRREWISCRKCLHSIECTHSVHRYMEKKPRYHLFWRLTSLQRLFMWNYPFSSVEADQVQRSKDGVAGECKVRHLAVCSHISQGLNLRIDSSVTKASPLQYEARLIETGETTRC